MKKATLLLAFAAALLPLNAFADRDTPGSSTDVAALHEIENGTRATFRNVHNGKLITASAKVCATDAVRDRHPFCDCDCDEFDEFEE